MAGRGKESALDLSKFVDKSIRVKLAGGREGAVPGTGCHSGRRRERQQGTQSLTFSLLSLPYHMCSCWSAQGV